MSINYNKLRNRADQFFIKESLKLINKNEECCNIYISFYTNKVGVKISDKLRKEYPEKMAIILQHQFSNLVINNNSFSIDLSFSGVIESVTIPFFAIEIFHDQDVNYSLTLEQFDDSDSVMPSFEEDFENEKKIISIDKFLNK